MSAQPELAAFIRNHFRSVWTLELVLFLKGNATQAWHGDALVEALRASDAILTRGLNSLLAGGLIVLEDDGAVRYSPATKALEAFVDQTQDLYATKPALVRRLIVTTEASGLSAFSDSFRLRRD